MFNEQIWARLKMHVLQKINASTNNKNSQFNVSYVIFQQPLERLSVVFAKRDDELPQPLHLLWLRYKNSTAPFG